MNTTTIRPGILVSVKSTVSGGVHYDRVDLENSKDEDGSAYARWQTTRTVDDPEEHERATSTRSRALGAIRRVCSRTSFGLLCPENRAAELDAAIAQARQLAAEHNDKSQSTRVQIFVLKGRVASTDEEAARAIGDEVRGLLDEMNRAIDKLDAEAIRRAADSARQLAAVLSDEQQAKVGDAIAQARKAARVIVKRIETDGEAASIVLKDIQRGSIERARIAFLDFEESTQKPAEPLPAVQLQRFDAVEESNGLLPPFVPFDASIKPAGEV